MTEPGNSAREGEVEPLIARMVEADFGRGPASARVELEKHLRQSPEQAELHDRVMGLWDRLGELDPPQFEPERRWWDRPVTKVAAVLLPLFLVAGLLAAALGVFAPDRYHVELAAVAAERRIVSLPDGSTVRLSPNSIVNVDLTDATRLLTLERGEALFEVAHDSSRPFLVRAGNGTVRAVGTAFNVRMGQRGVVVTVVDGTVQVTAADGADKSGQRLAQLASAGQQVVYGQDALGTGAASSAFLSPVRAVETERFTSWAEGVLRFNGEPLGDVIKEVNRYSARQLELDDPSLASVPIYGVLNTGDVEGLRSIVADLSNLDSRAVNRKMRIVDDSARDGAGGDVELGAR